MCMLCRHCICLTLSQTNYMHKILKILKGSIVSLFTGILDPIAAAVLVAVNLHLILWN